MSYRFQTPLLTYGVGDGWQGLYCVTRAHICQLLGSGYAAAALYSFAASEATLIVWLAVTISYSIIAGTFFWLGQVTPTPSPSLFNRGLEPQQTRQAGRWVFGEYAAFACAISLACAWASSSTVITAICLSVPGIAAGVVAGITMAVAYQQGEAFPHRIRRWPRSPGDSLAHLDRLYSERETASWTPVTGVVLGWCDVSAQGESQPPARRKLWMLWSLDPAVQSDWRRLYRLEKSIGAIACRRDTSPQATELADLWNQATPWERPGRFAVPTDLTDGIPFFISMVYLRIDQMPPGTGEDLLNSPDGYLLPMRVDPRPGPAARAILEPITEAWARNQREQRVQDLLNHGGQITTGCVVQANTTLWDADLDNDAYCLVLVSFDPIPLKRTFMLRLAEGIGYLKGGEYDDPVLQEISEFVTNERAEFYRWRKVPSEFASDYDVYLVDLWVRRDYLPHRCIVGRFLPIVTDPNEPGGPIEHVPQRLLTNRYDETQSTSRADDDSSTLPPLG